jgi:hypothetical protein
MKSNPIEFESDGADLGGDVERVLDLPAGSVVRVMSQESAEFWSMGDCQDCGSSYYDCAVEPLDRPAPGDPIPWVDGDTGELRQATESEAATVTLRNPDAPRCCTDCAHENWKQGGIWKGNDWKP